MVQSIGLANSATEKSPRLLGCAVTDLPAKVVSFSTFNHSISHGISIPRSTDGSAICSACRFAESQSIFLP
jgi:hypothetical protein